MGRQPKPQPDEGHRDLNRNGSNRKGGMDFSAEENVAIIYQSLLPVPPWHTAGSLV